MSGEITTVRVNLTSPHSSCLLELDPVAQRHMAKIKKYRGEYDKWGNRLTKSYLNVRHLLEEESGQTRAKGKRGKKKRVEDELDDLHCEDDQFHEEDYLQTEQTFSITLPPREPEYRLCVSDRPEQLSWSPRRYEVSHRSVFTSPGPRQY